MIAALSLVLQVAAAQLPTVIRTARIDPKAGVNFAAAVSPETVTVGEQALYQVAVFVSDEVRARLRRNPEFVPPELRAVLAYDPPGSYTRYERVMLAGAPWEVHVFQRAIFPLAPGRVDVPPARLSYAVPLSSSFFSREETYSVRSPSVTLVARDAPRAGRPDDWDGAVGSLSTSLGIAARTARVGEPVTVTMRVRGRGNVNLWPRPRLQVPWADVVPAGDRVVLDSVRLAVVGEKTFEWIVTPKVAGAQVVPPQRYPVWNPDGQRYDVVMTPPESLEVRPAAVTADGARAVPTTAAGEPLPTIRTRFRLAPPTPPWQQWGWWLVLGAAPMLAVPLARRRRRTRVEVRMRGAASPVADRAVPSASPTRATDALRREARIPVGASRQDLERALRRCGVTAETAARAAALDDALGRAAYGPAADPAARAALEVGADALLRQVRREMAPRFRRAAARVIATVALGGASLLGAVAPVLAWRASAGPSVDPREQFALGASAYAAGRMTEARDRFASAVAAAPTSPDAWANVGTVAFVLGDSGRAAAGWQRALRLEPLASDVRQRLALLPGPERSLADPVTIWPIGARELAFTAIGLWVVGWGALALAGSFPAALLVALAVATGTVAGLARTRERGTDLAVVLRAERLRALPALGADPVTSLATGEVVQIATRRDGWVSVRLPGGREGWIETQHLDALSGSGLP
ncbi:MAG: SH3 domain-containing protein [Gemmatimonadaceae bacterium]|nr:SH3 domain-containing protein [Gemmatimonadaceae bacterium]